MTTAVVTPRLVCTLIVGVSWDTTFGTNFRMGACVISMTISLAIETTPRSWDEDSNSEYEGADLKKDGKMRSVKGDSIEIGVFDPV